MTFDASRYLIKVQGGRDYLEVKWRIVWLHSDQPEASLETDLVRVTDTDAIVRAVIRIPREGGAERVYSGYARETNDGKFPYIEKAETSAIGRALAHAGFGTQFADIADEQPLIVDAPTARAARQPKDATTRDGQVVTADGEIVGQLQRQGDEPDAVLMGEFTRRLANADDLDELKAVGEWATRVDLTQPAVVTAFKARRKELRAAAQSSDVEQPELIEV